MMKTDSDNMLKHLVPTKYPENNLGLSNDNFISTDNSVEQKIQYHFIPFKS